MATRPTSEALRAFRKQLRLTQAEFADMLQTTRATYKNWESDISIPDEAVNRLQTLGFWDGKALRGAGIALQLTETEGRRVSLAGSPMVEVPVIGRASAGPGEVNVDSEMHSIWVPMSLAQSGGVGWVVEGDSMMPALEPGDIALFREHRQPKRGHTFLVRTPDREERVKIMDWIRGEWILRSLNPAYKPEPLAGHEILGFLIGWYKVRGTREDIVSDPAGLMIVE